MSLLRTSTRRLGLLSRVSSLPHPIHSPSAAFPRAAAQRTFFIATSRWNANNVQTGKQADTGAGAASLSRAPTPASYGAVSAPISGQSSCASHTTALAGAGADAHADIAEPSIQRPDGDWTLNHPIWKDHYLSHVEFTHLPPRDYRDKLALATIKAIRFNFDWMSGYTFGPLTERKAITRMVFLETVAGVPGSVGATLRHLASLRRMKRDGGWINTLMAEAENERMHLLTALEVRKPGWFMRMMVFLTQGVFFNFFWVSYILSPRFCHRLVGYLEEEAVVTYTKMLQCMENNGSLAGWNTKPAPPIAVKYWNLKSDATMKDVIAVIRADEAHHRDVNHTLGSLDQQALNPFRNKIA